LFNYIYCVWLSSLAGSKVVLRRLRPLSMTNSTQLEPMKTHTPISKRSILPIH